MNTETYQMRERNKPVYAALITDIQRYSLNGNKALTVKFRISSGNLLEYELTDQGIAGLYTPNDIDYHLYFFKVLDDLALMVEFGYIYTQFTVMKGLPMFGTLKTTCQTKRKFKDLDSSNTQKESKQLS